MGEDIKQPLINSMEVPEIPQMEEIPTETKSGLGIDVEGLKETMVNFIVPLVSLGIVAFLILVFALPIFKSLPELTATYKTNQDKIRSLESKVIKLKEIKKYQAVIDENSALVNKVLVSVEDVPRVSEQIRQISLNSGLTITRLNFSTSTGPLPGSATPEGLEGVEVATPVTRLSLGTDGVYGQIIAFMKSLEESAQLVTIDSFRFAKNNTSDTTGVLSLSFSLEAPYLFVQSNAVTDDAVNLNLNDPDFARIMAELKEYRYYEFSLEQLSAAKEELEAAEEETVTTPEGEDAPVVEGAEVVTDPEVVVPEGAITE